MLEWEVLSAFLRYLYPNADRKNQLSHLGRQGRKYRIVNFYLPAKAGEDPPSNWTWPIKVW